MSEPIRPEELEQLLRGKLEPGRAEAVLRAVAEGRVDTGRQDAPGRASESGLGPEPYDEVLPYEMIRAYVDGVADPVDREIIESLREDDPLVDQMIRDAEQVKRELEAIGNPVRMPAGAKAAEPAKRSLWSLLFGGAGLTLAGAAAAGLAVFALLVAPERDRSQSLAAQVREQTVAARTAEEEREQAFQRELEASRRQSAAQIEAERKEAARIRAILEQERQARPAPGGGSPITRPPVSRDRTLATQPDGSELVASADGTIYQKTKAPEDLAEAWKSGELPVDPDLVAMNSSVGESRGGGAELVSPVSTAVLSPRPVLNWRQAEAGSTWRVEVRQGSRVLARSDWLSSPTWTVSQDLAAGQYTWTVYERRPGSEIERSSVARFVVLSQERSSEVEAKAAAAGSALARVAIYAQAGLLDDAERELEALRKLNPNSPELRRWSESLKKARTPKKS